MENDIICNYLKKKLYVLRIVRNNIVNRRSFVNLMRNMYIDNYSNKSILLK